MKALRVALGALGWLALAVLCCWAWHLKDPHLRFLRAWEVPLLLALAGGGVAIVWRFARRSLRPMLLGLLCAVMLCSGADELSSRQRRAEVLAASDAQARRLGAHFIVGYENAEMPMLRELARHGAIGGIFVTGRNVKGRSATQLREEISSLQDLRTAAGLPPLIVATDQEGGAVSRLSPLIERQPSLATLIDADMPENELAQRARAYGEQQGRALAALGITLNFSPVVDLRTGRAPGRWDLHTRIDERAISADPALVAEVARAYEQGLEAAGVQGTLKHFPGLAGVAEDTHHAAGFLRTPAARLATHDWKPFQEVSASTQAAVMLAHVIVPELDPDHPASFSRKIVQSVIRGAWGHDGLLVTDDLTMGAAYDRGLCNATVRALNAGVDLLLVAYDHDKYFDAMHCARQAESRGAIDAAMLAASASRLARNPRLRGLSQ